MAKSESTFNPLSLGFGLALKQLRGSTQVSTIAGALQVGNSFVRLLEAGSTKLSPNRALRLIDAFGELEFEQVCKLLVAISATDNLGSTLFQYRSTLRDLQSAGNEDFYFNSMLIKLLAILQSAQDKNAATSPLVDYKEIIEEKIIAERFPDDVIKFLTTVAYVTHPVEDTAEPVIAESDMYDQEFEKLIADTPSIYIDTIALTLKNLNSINANLFANESSKWENENGKEFVSVVAVVTDFKRLLRAENVENFDLKYLFQDTFKELNYIILNDDNKSEAKWESEFRDTLLKRWNYTQKEEVETKYVQKALAKIKIKKGNTADQNIRSFLTTDELNDITWLFVTVRGNKIGFTLKPKPKEKNVIYGETLPYSLAKKKYKDFVSIWKTL